MLKFDTMNFYKTDSKNTLNRKDTRMILKMCYRISMKKADMSKVSFLLIFE